MKKLFTGKLVPRGKSVHRMWSFALVVPLLMAVAQLDACTGPGINEETNTEVRENTSQTATVNELLGNPDAFYGTEVAVTGEVTEVITPLTFELNGDINADSSRYGDSADGLLVIKDLEGNSDPEVEVGQTVEVTGTAREFNVQEVDDDISGSLAASVFTYWAGQSSLVATSVEPTGNTTAS
jgi:hypothetical protein